MALRKSELYGSLWKSCDELRGGMDASQYKDYVLVLLFVKYVSDKYAGQKDALIDVPKGGGFSDMVALKGNAEIGDKINKIVAKLAEANELKGVIDVADFNDPDKLGRGKEMVDRLSKLIGIFEGLNFSRNRADGDDLLGDAYEYRRQLKQLIPPLIDKWRAKLGVGVVEWGIKRMKTRWGTCHVDAKRIWLNLELAKKPPQCLEYLVMHEMVHFLAWRHDDRFVALMNEHLPQWRVFRKTLNAAPLAHESWRY